MSIADLPTLAEVEAMRRGKAIDKGRTRLEEKESKAPLTRVDEKAFRKAVIERDGKHCRCCGRKVIQTLERVPNRREIHHIHGRRGALRFESRCAILVCCKCHERCTGKVKDKLVIIATRTFDLWNVKTRVFDICTDATYPVIFELFACCFRPSVPLSVRTRAKVLSFSDQ